MRRFTGDKPRAIATSTYAKFAKKYGISTGNKTMRTIAQKIYNHEARKGVKSGLYFKPR